MAVNDPRGLDKLSDQSPQYMQQDVLSGIQKGIVVDVRDPYQQGRAKIAVYGMDGDYPDLNISNLDYAEFMTSARGGFSPPQLNDRVLVTYEAGDKSAPIVIGYWTAIPTGEGKLPVNKRTGSEIRPECWNAHDLYPETIMLASTGDGNVIHMTDMFLSKKYMASSINLIDTGGKYFHIKTYHEEPEQVWSPVDKFPNKKGSLYQQDYGENKSLRTGTETLEDLEPTAGSIEFGMHRTKRSMHTSKEKFSCDLMQQEDDEELTREEVSLSGKVYKNRLAGASIDMAEDVLFLSALAGVFMSDNLSPPRRYDE